MSFLATVALVVGFGCDDGTEEPENCDEYEPPQVLMVTESGEQLGVQGTFCASRTAACGECRERSVEPRQITVVRPGDELWFSMPAGELVARGKEDEREPMFRLDGPSGLSTVPLAEDERWAVDLPVGYYEVSTSSYFTGDDGSAGENHAYFGLAVDLTRERGVVNASTLDAGVFAGAHRL